MARNSLASNSSFEHVVPLSVRVTSLGESPGESPGVKAGRANVLGATGTEDPEAVGDDACPVRAESKAFMLYFSEKVRILFFSSSPAEPRESKTAAGNL